jgi:hypothetical protein
VRNSWVPLLVLLVPLVPLVPLGLLLSAPFQVNS